MSDRLMEIVAEFHRAFDCYVADQPTAVLFGATGSTLLSTGAAQMETLSRDLNTAAQKMKEFGDEGAALLLIRLQLIQEELAELADAMTRQDIVGCLDALADLDYVVTGTYLTLGLGAHRMAALEEVHSSNMSKLDENGRPIISASGRVVKGPNYRRPDLITVLGWRR